MVGPDDPRHQRHRMSESTGTRRSAEPPPSQSAAPSTDQVGAGPDPAQTPRDRSAAKPATAPSEATPQQRNPSGQIGTVDPAIAPGPSTLDRPRPRSSAVTARTPAPNPTPDIRRTRRTGAVAVPPNRPRALDSAPPTRCPGRSRTWQRTRGSSAVRRKSASFCRGKLELPAQDTSWSR